MGVVSCGTTMLDQGVFQNIGAVTWDTTAKTAGFTAVSGNGYFVNTTSGAITVTLPATPSAGDIIAVKDYANTFDTNNVTLARNGSNIGGEATDATLSTEGLAVTLVYVDSTKGWLVTDSGLQSEAPTPSYITATGGTITTSGDYKIHTFTGPGTFTVCSVGNPSGSDSVDYLVVAGGGGGFGSCGANSGGGGGAGGFRETTGCGYTSSPLGSGVSPVPVSATGYPISVGGGGAGSINNGTASGGSSSSALSITSTGGGGGGPSQPQGPGNGNPGGSGSGAGGGAPGIRTGGSGNTPPVSPPQGNDGGDKLTPAGPDHNSGGGGGATTAGAIGTPNTAPSGCGGTGATTSISGSAIAYAGGGGGAGLVAAFPCAPGLVNNGSSCGTGGSGAVTPSGSATAGSGTTNRGGGGGAASSDAGGSNQAGSGGSGVVIIRYKFQ